MASSEEMQFGKLRKASERGNVWNNDRGLRLHVTVREDLEISGNLKLQNFI